MNRPALIATRDLTKSYGKFVALRRLTLQIRHGEVFGLLGPNGSGKTTTIRLLRVSCVPVRVGPASRASIAGGRACRSAVWSRICLGAANLRLDVRPGGRCGPSDFREGDGLDRAVALAERVMGLDLRKKVRVFRGMKQKLALALAFADPVDILILDEPTSSLDPSARARSSAW